MFQRSTYICADTNLLQGVWQVYITKYRLMKHITCISEVIIETVFMI